MFEASQAKGAISSLCFLAVAAQKKDFAKATMTVSPTDSPIAAARARADAELKKALSGLDPNDFSSSVPAFYAFIDSVKLLFNEEGTELLHAATNSAAFKPDLLRLRERIVDEYIKAPPSRRLTKRQRRLLERPVDVDKRSPVEPFDKWDLFAPTGLLPNKKHDVRKELRRVLGEQLSYWLREASAQFERLRTSADHRPLLAATLKPGGREAGKMAESEFWRDIEARFRAIQSRKVPIHGVPWHDDSLYAVWLASGWSDTGDQWRLDGANHTVKVNFRWLAERAAVELGHPGGRSGVVFWLDLLKRDSPNYKCAGSGSSDNGISRGEHGKIDRVCEASADYCLRLETQDRISGARVPSVITNNGRTLTEAQQGRIADGERELNDNLAAHEMMREVLEPGEWRQAGHSPQGRTMAGEIPKLQRDIEECVIGIFRVLAEASWFLGSVELYRDQLQKDSYDLVKWAFAKVNPNDLLLLDKGAVETALADEISTWIRKAEQELPPPWKTSTLAQSADLEPLDGPQVEPRVFPAHAGSDEPMSHSTPPILAKEGERWFRRTGEIWSLQFDGKHVLIQHRVGMTYIGLLLRSPDRSLGCEALLAAAGGNPEFDKLMDKEERAAIPIGGLVPHELLDDKARKQYKDRLNSIESEMHEAKSNNDLAQCERLEDQKQRLIEELKAATGLGGRSRTFTNESEKARKAVARAIGTALTKIGEHHPDLAKHLDDRIERGGECRYEGDDIEWEV
jgi:hypothetical protein